MRFYILKQRQKIVVNDTEYDFVDGSKHDNADKCPACKEYIGLMKHLPPYCVELETWDSGYGDLAFSIGDSFLVSERFKVLWHEQGLAGLDGFHPVEIVKVKRHKRFQDDPPEYFLVNVCRSKVTIDQEASGFEWETPPTCPVCRQGRIIKRWKQIVLESDTWSRENVFLPRGLAGIFMADQRFKEFVEQFRITNCYLISAEEYTNDFYPCKNDSRG